MEKKKITRYGKKEQIGGNKKNYETIKDEGIRIDAKILKKKEGIFQE